MQFNIISVKGCTGISTRSVKLAITNVVDCENEKRDVKTSSSVNIFFITGCFVGADKAALFE